MKKVSISKTASFIILLLMGCHIAYYWSRLPDVVVSHFGADWEPNGWMSRDIFMLTYIGLAAVVALSFLGSIVLMRKVPISLINLPRKEYWMAPERKEETLAYLSETMFRFHNITQTFLLAVLHMVIDFNITGNKISSDTFWVLLAAYLGYTTLWTVSIIVRFARKPSD